MFVAGICHVCAGAGVKVIAKGIRGLGWWVNRWKLCDVCELLCIKVFVALYPRCFLMKATKCWPKR